MRPFRLASALCRTLPLGALVAALAAPAALAQTGTPAPKREVRAVWIATVSNLDWPRRGETAAQQQQHLVELLDQLRAQGINTIHFQIRTEGDAFYASPTEPWSQFLTGVQGQNPGYDPLAFAVAEAHKRGMELHAWFNPYRMDAAVASTDDLAPNHITKRQPTWLLNLPTLPNKRFLDPGIPAVRDYVIDVVGDVVTRYDVDGVHFDDYFYPYPEGSFTGMKTEDNATWRTYGAQFASIGIFRQYSVNMLVRGVQTKINSIRPSVKFGISPFGIWKSGTPAGTSGMSGADAIFADAVTWMEQGWLDYLTPQLYWKFGGGQDYAKLAPWWNTKMTPTVSTAPMPSAARHFIPGLITTTNQIKEQIAFNRANGYQGQSIFRAVTLLSYPAFHLDTLFVRRAVPLSMPWKNDAVAPNAPLLLPPVAAGNRMTLTWTKPLAASDGDTARWYAIYRFPLGITPDVSGSRYLVATVGGGVTRYVDVPPASEGPSYTYVMTAFDENWNESPTSAPLVGTDGAQAETLGRAAALRVSPQPARGATRVRFDVTRAERVRLVVYDVLGREVAVLVDDVQAVGAHEATFDAAGLRSGVYVVRREGGGAAQRASLVVQGR